MKEELTLDADAYLPLRDVVFHTLRDSILKGEMEPGERLMEIHLAKKLGVSRTPIREAIRMLEQEGLAVIVPRRGAQVAKMTEKDLQDVLEIRDALDELAALSACKKITPEAIDELKETMTSFKVAADAGDVREVAVADEKFHSIIYKAADNPKLMVIIKNLKEQMYRYRYEYVKDNANYNRILKEHEEIIRGFEMKDSDYVKKMMHAHLENQVAAVRDVIRQQED